MKRTFSFTSLTPTKAFTATRIIGRRSWIFDSTCIIWRKRKKRHVYKKVKIASPVIKIFFLDKKNNKILKSSKNHTKKSSCILRISIKDSQKSIKKINKIFRKKPKNFFLPTFFALFLLMYTSVFLKCCLSRDK